MGGIGLIAALGAAGACVLPIMVLGGGDGAGEGGAGARMAIVLAMLGVVVEFEGWWAAGRGGRWELDREGKSRGD